MPTIIIGSRDIDRPRPLKGFPEGKARVRIREDSCPVVFIRTAEGVKSWYPAISEDEQHWVPGVFLGANLRLPNG